MRSRRLLSAKISGIYPQTGVTWYEAARYCDWLSEQERIPREQWCYDPKGGAYGLGMEAKPKFWELTGYRLPTEAEWEDACRAGTSTSRYVGLSDHLLPRIAWYQANAKGRLWPVGKLIPNDLGLFDMLGNGWEWCIDTFVEYPGSDDKVVEDLPTMQAGGERAMRGGSFANDSVLVRSARRSQGKTDEGYAYVTLRPVRTIP